ncbi:DNA-binding response regulator [Streptomyces sp. TRM68367]|uniref:DNA-binding response regulator n=1 Tax=Streptomyces sp. TRM68367 TaxID=2758415 RepID=UPI0021D3E6BC|nr:DNA-binding response regulator [Streptomyces sp. TRM68367]
MASRCGPPRPRFRREPWFEAAWQSAADLSAVLDSRRPRIDDRTVEVLRALGSGATDEAAARELGMSLRTYRRRVAELLVGLDAASRGGSPVTLGVVGAICCPLRPKG